MTAGRLSRREAIEQTLDAFLDGGHGGLSLIDERPIAESSTHTLSQLVLRRSDGSALELVLKEILPAEIAGTLRQRPASVDDPRREIEVYRQLLGYRPIGAPRFCGAVVDRERQRYWLFLEHIDGVPLWQRGDVAAWQLTAERLARLHCRFAARPPQLPELLRYDAGYFRNWLGRLRRFRGDRLAADLGEGGFELLRSALQEALDWLATQPVTLLHGEAYPSNVLVQSPGAAASGRATRVRLLDWEMAGIGSPALDLAALTAGSWSEAERAAIAAAYRDAVPERMRSFADAAIAGLERCRLLVAVQWLGWKPRLAPPPHQVHDWLEEARRLSTRAVVSAAGRN